MHNNKKRYFEKELLNLIGQQKVEKFDNSLK